MNQLDKNGNLPLGLALFSGQEALAKTLLKHKANVNALDASGKSLLVKAIEQSKTLKIINKIFKSCENEKNFQGSVNVAKFLLNNPQLDVNAGTDDHKRSALLVLAACDSKTFSELATIADLILSKNPNFGHVDEAKK